MGFGTAAVAVFALGQVVLALSIFRIKRADLPGTSAGRRQARRMSRPGVVGWLVCAIAAVVLLVLGEPDLLALGIVAGVFLLVILGVAMVGDRRLERELDEREHRDDAE